MQGLAVTEVLVVIPYERRMPDRRIGEDDNGVRVSPQAQS